MTIVKARIRVAPDGTLTGRAAGLAAGEHEAVITVPDIKTPAERLDIDKLLKQIHEIQAELARLPVLNSRSPDEIIGYNEHGHFG